MNKVEGDFIEKRRQLDDLLAKYNFKEPDRGNLDDPQIQWRHGKPNYTKANLEYLTGELHCMSACAAMRNGFFHCRQENEPQGWLVERTCGELGKDVGNGG